MLLVLCKSKSLLFIVLIEVNWIVKFELCDNEKLLTSKLEPELLYTSLSKVNVIIELLLFIVVFVIIEGVLSFKLRNSAFD